MSSYKPIKVNLVNNVMENNLGFQPRQQPLTKAMPSQEFKAYQEPPLVVYESIGYKDKMSSLTYNTLYQMSVKNSVVGAVINTRVNQVSSFTKPSRFSEDNLGYKIRLRDPKATPTEDQLEIIQRLELFIENCGFTPDASRDDFDTFIRKLVRDSLTYDQATFEIVPDRRGYPAEFVVVDASTIRSATGQFEYDSYMGGTHPKQNEDVAYVQVIDGVVKAWFTNKELAFGVRNPRSSIYMQPYGFSELEQLITQITSHLYAEEYNSKFFSQGGTTKGIINLKDPNGVMNLEQLESFKRQWRAQVSGMTGAWKTPVVQVPEGIEYINVSQSNREMEFEKWMNYLINIVCAVYQIDPSEVNFPNNGGVGGTGGGVFESSNEARIKNSKDKGLRPLLRFIESLINKNIVSKFSSEYVFSFTGIDEKSEEDKVELYSKKVKSFMTINEVRAENGMETMENGDVLLDPSWLNYVNQQAVMQGNDEGADDNPYEEDIPSEDEDSDDTETPVEGDSLQQDDASSEDSETFSDDSYDVNDESSEADDSDINYSYAEEDSNNQSDSNTEDTEDSSKDENEDSDDDLEKSCSVLTILVE